MTYQEYKKVTEFLNIQSIQVVVKLGNEYQNFKNIDLIENYEEIFMEIDNFIDDDVKDDRVIFWLDIDSFKLLSYQILEKGDDIVGSTLIDSRNIVRNQIVLDFDSFIKLIS